MRLALYGRTSLALKQDPAGQILELERWANAAGHEVEGTCVDQASRLVRKARGSSTRPGLPRKRRTAWSRGFRRSRE